MFTIFRIFYAPAQPFIGHPERANLMAAGFAILFGVSILHAGRFKPLTHVLTLLATLLWVAFGLNEIQAQQNGWDIRVDLLLLWPVLFVISVASAWLGIRGIIAGESDLRPADTTTDSRPDRA